MIRKCWCWADVVISIWLWYRKIMSGRHLASDKSANVQKTDVGPTLFLDPYMISGNWRWADIWPDVTNVGKDEIHDKTANDQKIDVGPTLLFRPDYDIAKLMSGRHLASVGKDDIHNKSANCQKIDIIISWANVVISTWLWYRKTDIGPLLGKMAFITSRQPVRKLMLGRCCFLTWIMISGNWRRADIWNNRRRKRWNSWQVV